MDWLFQAALDRADRQLDGKEWLFEHLTIADFALFFLENWAITNGIGAVGSNCRRHYERLMSRSAIRSAIESEMAYLP